MERIEADWLRLVTAPRGETAADERRWIHSMQSIFGAYLEIEQQVGARAREALRLLPPR